MLAVQPFGNAAIKVTYEMAEGETGQRRFYPGDLPNLQVEAKAETGRPFDGDGAMFRVAAEALRIRMAGQFDPMLAVHTSELEPLPHQIKAVYGELRLRVRHPHEPPRFLRVPGGESDRYRSGGSITARSSRGESVPEYI